MDRAYLLRRHDEELERAAAATCDDARHSHEQLARQYADHIARLSSEAAAA